MSTKAVFKRDEIVVLLGAGASVEAGVPASRNMINKIEDLLQKEWANYRDLYNFVKSSIHYADGLKGRFNPSTFNIEQVVSTLDELRRGDEHPLYPFVGAWVPKLYEVAGSDLAKVSEFRSAIVRRLRDDWVQLRYGSNAAYFAGLLTFQEEYQHPLRVFTLNYDLCVEHNCGQSIQRGFDEAHRWDWRLFEERQESESKLLLYKLHGSIDWTYDEGNLIYVDGFSQIAPDDIAIIFGTTYKLQYVDPFLFFAYEFRRYTLDFAKLILTVGYGFADQHINGILSQALNRDPKRKLLSVSLIKGEDDDDRQRKERERLQWIRQQLTLRLDNQVTVHNMGTKDFLSQGLTLRFLGDLFPADDENLFEEIVQQPEIETALDNVTVSKKPAVESCADALPENSEASQPEESIVTRANADVPRPDLSPTESAVSAPSSAQDGSSNEDAVKQPSRRPRRVRGGRR